MLCNCRCAPVVFVIYNASALCIACRQGNGVFVFSLFANPRQVYAYTQSVPRLAACYSFSSLCLVWSPRNYTVSLRLHADCASVGSLCLVLPPRNHIAVPTILCFSSCGPYVALLPVTWAWFFVIATMASPSSWGSLCLVAPTLPFLFGCCVCVAPTKHRVLCIIIITGVLYSVAAFFIF